MDVHFLEGGVTPVTKEDLKTLGQMFAFEDEDAELLERILAEAAQIARPKAVFMHTRIEEIGEDYICIAGVKLTSELVRKNVEHCEFILPYTATCGRELYEWAKQYESDILMQYACESIQELYLRKISMLMSKKAKELYYKDMDISSMAPGSLDAMWPITQQKALFTVLGGHAERAGVALTDSCLMIPAKSVSGFYFSSEQHFENCMLCSRKNCPNRRAKFKGGA